MKIRRIIPTFIVMLLVLTSSILSFATIGPGQIIIDVLGGKGTNVYGIGSYAIRQEVYLANRGGISTTADWYGHGDNVTLEKNPSFNSINHSRTHLMFLDYIKGKFPTLTQDNNKPVSVELKAYKTAVGWTTSVQECEDGRDAPNDGISQRNLAYFKRDEKNKTASEPLGEPIYFSAYDTPYIVLPENNHNNIQLGDVGFVRNKLNGKTSYVIYAERGPCGVLGEVSAKTYEELGATSSTNDYLNFEFIMFPGSGKRRKFDMNSYTYTPLPTNTEIRNAVMQEIEFYERLAIP